MQSTKNSVKTIMVQGTTSDAGKSTLVTALCRYYYRKNLKVVPFKPQNMALNSAVTIDGGEIGRAQAVQAIACKLQSHSDMNPILLKPESDQSAQVIIHGIAKDKLSATQYHDYKNIAMQAVLESYHRLTNEYEMIVVEGAGSPAEINLREGDIANMGFAETVNCPVILIADIDKGGVFAHIYGTLELLSRSEQQRIIGFVINRFRGDIALLKSGIEWLENKTGKPVFAVLPYLQDLYLDAEDAISIDQFQKDKSHKFNIVIPLFPRISNHTDFDPLILHPDINAQFVKKPEEGLNADLIILPGSKSVRDDLDWLYDMGWNDYILKHLRYDGRLIGICGGFQMLGSAIHDPKGIEGKPGSSTGLGFLDMETTFDAEKCLNNIHGQLYQHKTPVSGYEIHAGVTSGSALQKPVMLLDGKPEGAYSDDNRILGTYLHGLFNQPESCLAMLNWAGFKTTNKTVDINTTREVGITLLTDTLEQHFDFDCLGKQLEWFDKVKTNN